MGWLSNISPRETAEGGSGRVAVQRSPVNVSVDDSLAHAESLLDGFLDRELDALLAAELELRHIGHDPSGVLVPLEFPLADGRS